ncbi:MAG: MarR family transcriptional regulator [Chloroflexota bacterium]
MTESEREIQTLVRRMREVTAASPDAWEDVELTLTQLRGLFVLGARQPLRVSDLAGALGMSLASASALSDRLVRLGYVARRSDPDDRRTVLLHLATKGVRLLERLDRRSTDKLSRAIQQMTGDERTALATALRAFLRVASLESTRPPRASKRGTRKST